MRRSCWLPQYAVPRSYVNLLVSYNRDGCRFCRNVKIGGGFCRNGFVTAGGRSRQRPYGYARRGQGEAEGGGCRFCRNTQYVGVGGCRFCRNVKIGGGFCREGGCRFCRNATIGCRFCRKLKIGG